MALIEIRDLEKKFNDQRVLAGVNLNVEVGEIKVVMGPSGCGKSTLLRCLNRLVEPTSGSIRFDGIEVTSPATDVRLLRQKIGFVFQQFALYRHLSVLDNVTLGLRKLQRMSKSAAEEKAALQLQRLGMFEHKNKFPGQISGGQKQRAALARALAMDPAMIVLDEPTSALDPVMSREVGELIKQLHAEGITMLCVTHDIDLAQAISETVVFLDQGVVKAEARLEHLSAHADPATRAFFSRTKD